MCKQCVCVCTVCVLSGSDVTFIPHASRARLAEHTWAVPQVFPGRIRPEIDPKRVLPSVATLTFDTHTPPPPPPGTTCAAVDLRGWKKMPEF